MSSETGAFREQELVALAALAGIETTPHSRPRILENLLELRDHVLEFSKTLDDNTVPATQFIAD